jgi:DNA-binding LacI/PurR family transcriptional regulator
MADLKQAEIAKLAGVSQATVSRVLKGDPQVNAEMRERVLAVVQQLGYVPDARAQSLRSQRTRLLGLVIHRAPDALAGDPFFSALIAMIVEQAGRYDYHLCVDTARTARSQRAIYEELLRTRRVDGLILVESETQDRRIERLSREGFPFVLIGRYEPEDAVCSVDNDNIGAAYMATDYLLRTGRRRVAYLGGPAGLTVTRDRLQGYKAALEAHGVGYDPCRVVFADFNARSAASATTESAQPIAAPRRYRRAGRHARYRRDAHGETTRLPRARRHRHRRLQRQPPVRVCRAAPDLGRGGNPHFGAQGDREADWAD